MLDAEHALAKAGVAVGLVPADAAARIGEACRADLFDAARIADDGRAVGNPAEPLVRELSHCGRGRRGRVRAPGSDEPGHRRHGGDARLAARRRARAGRARPPRGRRARSSPATHRSTPMAARTLLQQAVPTTFGLKAAGWLVAVLEARRRLAAVRDERLAAQLGGAAGNSRRARRRRPRGRPPLRTGTRPRGAPAPVAREPPAPRGARRGAGCSRRGGREGRPRRRAARADRGGRGRRGYRAAVPRRCRRSAIPSAPRSRSRARVSLTPTRESYSASSHTSTSGRWAAGTPSGRRSRARSRSPAEQRRRPRTPSPDSRSTPSGCGRTSRRAAASSSPSASRSRSPSPGPRPGARRSSPRPREAHVVSRRAPRRQRTGLSADELDALLDPTGYLGVGRGARRPRARRVREARG